MNSYSFFIPRLSARLTKEQVGEVFENLGFGKISRINTIVKQAFHKRNRAILQ
jgi:hypothetical protein